MRQILVSKPKGKDRLEALGVDGIMIVNLNLEE